MQLQAAASLSKGSVTIQGEPESGWLFKISRWLLTQTTISDDGTQASRSTIPLSLDRIPEKQQQTKHTQNHHDLSVSGKYCIPSTCLLTVHTALGLPGSSDTAISDT